MKNILILTSRCYSNADSNGICARDIFDCFNSKGYCAYILGYSPNKEEKLKANEFCFFYKKQHANKTLNKKLNSLKRIIRPEVDQKLVNEYVSVANELIESKKIDMVISFYFPVETEIAVNNIKRKHSEIMAVAYEIDSATDVAYNVSRLGYLHNLSYIRYKIYIYKGIDYLIIMNSHMEYFRRTYKQVPESKIRRADLPVIFEHKLATKNTKNKKKFDLLYTGYLNKDSYSPKPFIDFMKYNADKLNWRLHFYSSGNCEDIIKDASMEDERIVSHGYVGREELNHAMSHADVFFSIESKYKPNNLPSKIFRYFAYCKPILHFNEKKSFISEECIKKYPLGFHIQSIENDNKSVIAFLNNHSKDEIDYKKIVKTFITYTPQYSVNIIESLFK